MRRTWLRNVRPNEDERRRERRRAAGLKEIWAAPCHVEIGGPVVAINLYADDEIGGVCLHGFVVERHAIHDAVAGVYAPGTEDVAERLRFAVGDGGGGYPRGRISGSVWGV